MPKIPDASALGVRPTPVSDRPVSGYRGGIAEAAAADEGLAMARVGQQAVAVGEKIQDREDNLSVVGASSALLRNKLALDQKYQDDPDYQTAPERYAADLQKARDAAAGTIGSPALRSKFALASDDVIARSVAGVQARSRKRSLDALSGWTLDTTNANLDAAARTSDPAAQHALLENSLALFDAAAGKQAFTSEHAATLKQAYRETFAETVLKAMPADQRLRALTPASPSGGEGPAPTGDRLDAAINDAASSTGENADTLRRIAMLESGGKADATNPSGASGAFQFMPGTARQYGLSDPTDVGASAEAAAKLARDNRAALRKSLGREPTEAEIALAHQQGAAGAAALVSNPDKPALDVLTQVYGGDTGKAKAALTQNGGDVNMTAGEFAQLHADRFDKAGSVPPGATAAAAPAPTGTIADILRPDKKEALIRTTQAELHSQDIQRRQEQEQVQQGFTSDFEIKLARGEKSYSDIEDAYRAGNITSATRTRFTLFLDSERQKQEDQAALMARAAAAGNGGPPLDPKSKADKKAVDLLYSATSAQWQNLQPAEVLDRSIAFATQKGMVPEKLRAVIRGGLHSGDPAQAVMAADAMQRLRNANPQLLDDIGDESDRRLGTLIGTLTDAGLPAAQAVQRANDSLKVNKADMEARAADYDLQRGKTKADRLASDKSWIEGKVNSIFTLDPTVDPVMAREFGDVAGIEYQRTGNLDAARQFALDTVNRVWGRSRVGGSLRYMKFAPEKFYGVPDLSPDENAKWMNEQLLADVSKGAFQETGNPITADRLLVMPDPTRSAPDGRPVYTVSLKGSDGIYRAVTGADGSAPLAWSPDWNTSAEKKRHDDALAQTVAMARAARTRKLTGSGLQIPDSMGGVVAVP